MVWDSSFLGAVRTGHLRRGEMSIAFPVVACFAAAVLACSCAGTPEDIEAVGLIVSGAVNWDDDPEPDGVQFVIRPQDVEGFMVKAEGSLNAKLWSQPDDFKEEKGKLIQEWSDIHVTKKDYTEDLIARIRLEYNDYAPVPGERGILHVTLTMPHGRSFTFEESNMSLNPRQGIQRTGEQLLPGCCP